MKRIYYTFLAILAVSCGSNQTVKPIIIDERYEPTDSELFEVCAELQGVGQFIIGKTTFKQVLADKDFKKEATSVYDRQSNMYNGHWGSDFWKGGNGEQVLPGSDKAKWMEEKTAKKKLKQLPSSAFSGLSVGGLKFNPFDMAFLNDTLVAIFFYPDDEIESDVLSHYKQKYGNGRGKLHSSNLTIYGANSDLTVKRTLEEMRSWENKDVALSYEKHEYFHMEPKQTPVGNFKKSMIIYSKKRYPIFRETLLNLSEEFDKQAIDNKTQSLNSL